MRLHQAMMLGFALSLAMNSALRAADAPVGSEATIPSANHGAALLDWEPDEDQGLWVEDGSSQWYYASFKSGCPQLRLATTLNFDTGAADTFGRDAAVQLPGGARCYVSSLTVSSGPDAPPAAPQTPASTDSILSRR